MRAVVCIVALSVAVSVSGDDTNYAGLSTATVDAGVTTAADLDILHVSLRLGALRGAWAAGGAARAFLSVPFAAPPTGALRWRAPEPPTPWAGVLDATHSPPGCPQRCSLPDAACPRATSEDCLLLNVWTPAPGGNTSAPPWPVAVYLHGGVFTSGFAGGPGSLVDAAVVAARTGTVWVVPNYRLGALGWLHLGAARVDAPGGGIRGNFGLLDAEAALTWVRDHIAAFGGDPGRVTLVGQSAGASAVAALLVRGASAGVAPAASAPDTGAAPAPVRLFHGAILHSAPLGLPFRTPRAQRELAHDVAARASCAPPPPPRAPARRRPGGAPPPPPPPPPDWADVEACLRLLPAEALVDAQDAAARALAGAPTAFLRAAMPFTPTVDEPGGDASAGSSSDFPLPQAPLAALRAGAAADVPVLLGTTADEAHMFVFGPRGAFAAPLGRMMYSLGVPLALGAARSAALHEHYPLPPPQQQQQQPQPQSARQRADVASPPPPQSPPEDLRPHVSRLLTDGLFACPARAVAAALRPRAGGRTAPAFLFEYDHAFAFGRGAWGDAYPACWDAACHGTDLLSLFAPDPAAVGGAYSAADAGLTDAVHAYWGSFLRTGRPDDGGGGGRRKWPAHTARNRAAMRLRAHRGGGDNATDGAAVVRDARAAQCDSVWDAHGYDF